MSDISKESIKVERILSEEPLEDDWLEDNDVKKETRSFSNGIRPKTFADYPGQQAAKENLKVFVKAALKRGKPLDHVLLHGPPGLGKTTLAHIVANELEVPFFTTSGPSIDKPGDLAGILAGLDAGSLLFIDEIHRLTIQVEEVLYGAMEDFAIDIVVGQGPTARSVKMEIAPFTLVGATTKLSSLSRPFLSRFGIQERLMFYDIQSLTEIIHRSTSVLGIKISSSGAVEIAKRSRGTPRIANRLLRRAWDFAEVKDVKKIDLLTVQEALSRLDIDSGGLDRIDREILNIIKERYRGGPVGIEAIAITLGEERATIEDVYEPFLVYQGFLSRGPRGRSLTDLGRTHLESFH